MDKKEKNMIGKKIVGYICKDQEENIDEKETKNIYMIASDSLDLNTNNSSSIYRVEGISKVKKELYCEQNYYERPYYICDNINIQKEISIEEIIEMCLYTQDSIYRIIAFYPLTEKQALKIAKIFKKDYYVIEALTKKYPQNPEIKELFELASIEHNKQKEQEKYEKILKKVYAE